MLTTHNFSCLFVHLTLTHLRLIFKMLCNTSSWMTANLLTLNSSKTEFLLICLQQQLAKIHKKCSLNTTDSARNLGFIFDSHLTFSDQILSLSKPFVIITFVNFAVSAPILTSKLSVPLPHLLFTLSLITATLCTTNFQNLKQIVFRLFRTLLHGMWFRLPNSVTSPLFSDLYIGLNSTNALNINLFLLPTKLLPLLNLLICTAPSCYSLIICCHPLSKSLSTSSLRISNCSIRYASPHLWNQLPV